MKNEKVQKVSGKQVQLESDYKPVFKKGQHKAYPRLQGMLMRLQAFNLCVTYKLEKDLHFADTLSRQEQPEQLLEEELKVNLLPAHLAASEEKLNQLKTATAEDEELQSVMNAVQSGWPELIGQILK